MIQPVAVRVRVTLSVPIFTPRSTTAKFDVPGVWARAVALLGPAPSAASSASSMVANEQSVFRMIRRSDQYRIIAAGAGWHDKRGRGRLRFDGRDAAAFLHALVSNDVQSLREGQGTYAAYLTPQGRLIADLRAYHRGGHLLVDTPPGLGAALAARFDQLIFAEDARVSDVSESLSQAGVIGASAAGELSRAFGLDAASVEALPLWAQLGSGGAVVVRTDDADLPSYDVFMPAEAFDADMARFEEAGAVKVPHELVEALRIEAGRPAFGVDMTEETIPLEAGLLERAISMTKGCYVGQEVIVRVLHRGGGRVVKRLVRIDLDPAHDEIPRAGAAILADGRDIGRVTSAAWSPRLEHAVALGYAHRESAEAGRGVSIQTDGRELTAIIAGLAG
jgi:tRNA-modifying protein YgfZ